MNRRPTVTIRQRSTSEGRQSLYLDIYSGGRRKTESLGLFLVGEKRKDRETIRMAEAIRSKRLLEAEASSDITCLTISQAFEDAIKTKSPQSAKMYLYSMRHILNVLPPDKRVSEITKSDCERVIESLACSDLSRNTASVYFTEFSAVLNRCVRDGVIASNPCRMSGGIRKTQTERTYLTVDELRTVINHDWMDGEIKRQFVFSCLTGLRYSDIQKLEWSEVSSDCSRLTFRQKKTGVMEYLDINRQASDLLGERSIGRVFAGRKASAMDYHIDRECRRAGIDKHITFHSARHTFATMMLTLGVDIYTVSKLLGHSDISTTQIYAKIIDSKKKEAVSKIPIF